MKQKRLVTIQDLSCLGKCSLTVALPVISALGIETVVLPTAILSTHTGCCFNNYTFRSLEDDFEKIADNWEKQNISFDAIYVGYIGSLSLIEEVERFVDRFRKNAVVFIDPAMADEGKFYRGLDKTYSRRLAALCHKADIISPNYTEALILAGYDPSETKISDDELFNQISDISNNVIITGIHKEKDIVTIAGCKKQKSLISRPNVKGSFYGAGDLFASAFIGFYLNGISLEASAQKAASFVSECIYNTLDEKEKYTYGLKFEQKIGMLEKMLKNPSA